jgi:hypothetical protein
MSETGKGLKTNGWVKKKAMTHRPSVKRGSSLISCPPTVTFNPVAPR